MSDTDDLIFVDDTGGGRISGYTDREASQYPESNRWYRLVPLTDEELAAFQAEPDLERYLALIESERESRPAEAMLADEIRRLRSLVLGDAFGASVVIPVKNEATAAAVYSERQENLRVPSLCGTCGESTVAYTHCLLDGKSHDNLAQIDRAQHGTVNDGD